MNNHSTEPDPIFAAALDAALRPADLDAELAAVDDPSIPSPPARPGDRRYTRNGEGKWQVQSLSHAHEAIMNWMILHPMGTARDCAAHFGCSAGWVTMLKNSDLFKARMRERQNEIMSLVASTSVEKLEAIADLSLDKILDELETTSDKKFIHETAKLALQSLGFGGGGKGGSSTVNAQNVQQNFYVATPSDLVAARGMIVGGAVSCPAPNDGHARDVATPTQPAEPPALGGPNPEPGQSS